MIVDLHSHYLPPSAVGPGSPVSAGPATEQTVLSFDGADYRVPQALLNAEQQVTDAQRQGLDRRVLLVPPFAVRYELAPRAGVDWSRRLNDGIAAAVQAYPRHLIGFAVVPLQAGGEAAAAELVAAVRGRGMSGVEVLTSVGGEPIDAPELEPFWAAAAELGVPVFVHPHFVSGAARMSRFHLRNLVGNPTETALTGAQLLFGGLLDRHPGLTVVLAHGGGALPHLVGRLEHGHRHRAELADLPTGPRAQLRRFHYDSVVFDPTVLRHVGEIVGFDRLVVGSDYPFDMADEDPVGFVASADLPRTVTESVLHAAARVLPGLT
ncbi:amidohydrolase family protein [Micromonospora sp. WMMD1128]|uniref:amidohydrolase family protein n=1 Tax=unclassified Micromonospora TaxID=2617518 RepID=UPI00248BB1FE|nr:MULTISPECIES: amidohydrolase family protein [unclassified Micromonospora]WBB71326.1 amidohydrolase family protein [Micromonospora sp. WMMD1128]WFE35205.1 amidohydrolase family protein [Micromonospora sp. WMMD975]